MLHLVIDNRIVVNMLFLVGNDTSIEHTLGTLATESKIDTVACHSIM